MTAAAVSAQTYVDTFDSNELGWTELTGDEGEAIIKSGVMHVEGKNKGGESLFTALTGIGGYKEPSYIETHCYAPVDVTKDFEISCDAYVKKVDDSNTFGIIIDYLDEGNFVFFSISEGRASMYRYKDFELVGRMRNDIKLKSQRRAEVKLALKCTFNKIEFFVNDMKALECRYLPLMSNGIGFYVYGKQTVEFDNLTIRQ